MSLSFARPMYCRKIRNLLNETSMFHYSVRTARSTLSRRSLLCTRREIFTETIQTLSNTYLDLAVALPYPPTWPVYSSTIILVGVISRLVLLPISIWARNRERRAEEFVVPYLRAYRVKLEARARHEAARAGADSKAAHDYFNQVVSTKIKLKRNELFKEHRCTPWVTMLVPPASQIPIFVALSATFFHVANESGSVLRDEAFLTLPSLALPDPTVVLPIVLGVVSLATIETSKWFVTEEQARRLSERQRRDDIQRAQGKVVVQPLKYTRSILRGLSVGRIVLAAMAPGSIEVYWLSSATFGLLQNWGMDLKDRREETVRKSGLAALPRSVVARRTQK